MGVVSGVAVGVGVWVDVAVASGGGVWVDVLVASGVGVTVDEGEGVDVAVGGRGVSAGRGVQVGGGTGVKVGVAVAVGNGRVGVAEGVGGTVGVADGSVVAVGCVGRSVGVAARRVSVGVASAWPRTGVGVDGSKATGGTTVASPPPLDGSRGSHAGGVIISGRTGSKVASVNSMSVSGLNSDRMLISMRHGSMGCAAIWAVVSRQLNPNRRIKIMSRRSRRSSLLSFTSVSSWGKFSLIFWNPGGR